MRHVTRQARWTDRDGTEWTLLTMPPIRDMSRRVGLRSREYAFVVILHEADEDLEIEDDDLQTWVDRAMGRTDDGPDTARLWIDPRSRTEWEVSADADELMYRRGTEVVRTSRDEHDGHPRELTSAQLQDALDEAQDGEAGS